MGFDQAANACPVCDSADQTQPVQGIIASQTSHMTGYGSSVGLVYGPGGAAPVSMGNRTSFTSSTPLAAMLSLPPARPPRGLVIAGWLFILIGVSLAVLIGYGVHHDNPDDSLAGGIVGGMFVTAVLWIPGIIFVLAGRPRLRRFHRQAPLREAAWRVWSTARYCFRDHVVYLPDGGHAPPELLRPLIFDTAQRSL